MRLCRFSLDDLTLTGFFDDDRVIPIDTAAERDETFPYVFMKPPTTTLTHPGDPVSIPRASPDHIDWECELGVVIGRRCRDVTEADALGYVAGYTVVNDITDRKYQPNPG